MFKGEELHEILNPCTCGCKRIWVIHYKSFLSHKCHVECTGCDKRTKTFIRIKRAIQEWNNIN